MLQGFVPLDLPMLYIGKKKVKQSFIQKSQLAGMFFLTFLPCFLHAYICTAWPDKMYFCRKIYSVFYVLRLSCIHFTRCSGTEPFNRTQNWKLRLSLNWALWVATLLLISFAQEKTFGNGMFFSSVENSAMQCCTHWGALTAPGTSGHRIKLLLSSDFQPAGKYPNKHLNVLISWLQSAQRSVFPNRRERIKRNCLL